MPDSSPVRLLSLDELQRKLGVSRTQVWTLRRTPGFPAPILIGSVSRGKRFIESEIDAWLLAQDREDALCADSGPASDTNPAGGPASL